MKRFCKCLLNGIKIFFASLISLIILITAGIYFYETTTANGYDAVVNFFAGIISLLFAIACLYGMGDNNEIK